MADRPSFTDDVKAELANVHPARPCCREAELYAIVSALGGEPQQPQVSVRVPRNAVARKIVQLVRATGGTIAEVSKGRTEKRPSYRLRLTLPRGRGSSDSCCGAPFWLEAFSATRPTPTTSRLDTPRATAAMSSPPRSGRGFH